MLSSKSQLALVVKPYENGSECEFFAFALALAIMELPNIDDRELLLPEVDAEVAMIACSCCFFSKSDLLLVLMQELKEVDAKLLLVEI